MRGLLFLFCALTLPFAAAQEANPDPAKAPADQAGEHGHSHDGPEVDAAVNMLVQVQVEFIELPHEKLSELLITHSPAKSRQLRERVQELVKDGTAKILETQLVTGRSGEKLRSEACQELIYPTEYDAVDLRPPGPVDPHLRQRNTVPFTPSAFETRNMGSLLEIEATLSEDGKVIDMLIDPELTWYTGSSVWLEEKDALGNISKIQMPEIYSMKLHSAVTLRAGSILFTAALSPKDGEGHADLSRKVMVFVKADVVP